jgi:hypothetical protein
VNVSRALLSMLASLALCGCGGALDPLIADKPDYEQYRKTRLSSTHEQRLAASFEYLDQRPQGRFRTDVERWFVPAERAYFAAAKGDLGRLRAYLDTLPRGPHAKQAAERIVELELAREYVRRRDERLTEQARAVETKLADAAAMRQSVVDALGGWSRHLSKIRSFGKPTSELDHELIFAWRIQEPAARCVGERCVKSVGLHYAIPDSGRLAPRKALFDVVVELERGGVVRATLAGPELFSRVGEALELRPVRPSDAQARAEAIGRALSVVQGAIEPQLPAARCQREAVSPVVLERRCDGVVLRMIAAPTAVEDDDRIVVEPEPSP